MSVYTATGDTGSPIYQTTDKKKYSGLNSKKRKLNTIQWIGEFNRTE